MPHRPTLANLKRQCPQDLSSCEGYTWHLNSRIGKGSFGEVFLGWTKDGSREVAVKVVNKDFFKQDPKVRENLEREIRIMKLLRGCEYVVHLHHVQDLKTHIVLVMELCDYDLDKLVKVSPFKEDDITLFLYQLAQGMRALRDHNVVHRDLKPGNILIKRHPKTGKMVIKLADFGFARHFKDEGAKPIDMTSLAGTPVFMAPEALRCVFYAGEHYDDKVDIWSIGALLYKVIVGECGFFAQLQEIPKILKHKGDAIAFKRTHGTRKISYINELPPEVNDRFSAPYRAKMNELLRSLLKLDPAERMTFPEFFEFVDDLITSKVEVVNLLHGTSFKIIYDPNMTSEQLQMEVTSQSGLTLDAQVIFSTTYNRYLSPHTSMDAQQFSQFLQLAGGSQGHAILYLLPTKDLSELLEPEYSCLAKLFFAVEDAKNCVELIYEHKLTDEIVKGILYLQQQQQRQRAGLDTFREFCSRELEQFLERNKYTEEYQHGLQSLAQGTLAINWLMFDLDQLAATPLPQAVEGQLKQQLQTVEQQRTEIHQLVNELDRLYQVCKDGVSVEINSGFDLEEVTKSIQLLSEEARKLPKTRRDYIHTKCEGILRECKIHINDVTSRVQKILKAMFASLSGTWSMSVKSQQLKEKAAILEQQLTQVVPECRGAVFKALASPKGAAVESSQKQSATGAVAATSPGVFPRPPPSVSTYTTPPVPVPTPGADPALLTAEREEKEKYQRMYEAKKKECSALTDQIMSMKREMESSRSDGGEEEKTLLAHQLPKPTEREGEGADSKVLAELTTQLQQFCQTAEKMNPGISKGSSGAAPKKPESSNPHLYPDLMSEYSVISMPGEDASPMDSLQQLLPQANRLMSALHDNMGKMEVMGPAGSNTHSSVFVKVAKPDEYEKGDMVIFHPIKLQRSKSSAPILMHVERPKPYILMDLSSYGAFGIRPGRMPDLLLGKLKEKPRKFYFEREPDMSKELGETTGVFFRVNVEPCQLRFSRHTHPTPYVPPPRPQPPNPPGGQSSSTMPPSRPGHRLGGLIRRNPGAGYI